MSGSQEEVLRTNSAERLEEAGARRKEEREEMRVIVIGIAYERHYDHSHTISLAPRIDRKK